jgi:hypothetical protein
MLAHGEAILPIAIDDVGVSARRGAPFLEK